MIKVNRRNVILLYLFLIICLIFASFKDFSISLSLYDPSNFLGIFLAAYGQFPVALVISIIACLKLKNDDYSFKAKIIYILLKITAISYACISHIKYFSHNTLILSIFCIMLIFYLCDNFILKISKDCTKEEIKNYLYVLFWSIVLMLVIVNGLKIIWQRPRMRLIMNSNVGFKPWWKLGNFSLSSMMISDEYKSFPSAHTSSASMLLLLCTLPYLNDKYATKENQLFLISTLLTICVAVSRIIMGAHFLSDVVLGYIIGLSCIIFCVRKFLR